MTKRTKIERVGGHLLIEGGSYTGEDNCQEEVALPVATLRVENRNARSVFICVVGDPINVPNVIAHGWTAREVLEVAYGGGEWLYPKPTDETRALVDQINALVEAGTEEIERLRARVAELEEERLRADRDALRDEGDLEFGRAKDEEIAMLQEALLAAEYMLGQMEFDDEIEATLRKVRDALAPARVRAGLILEAAGVER